MSLYVDIDKTLGAFHLQVRFEAQNGLLSLLGASGCGKSVTLKCIADIERPDRGKIEVGRRSDFVIMDDDYNVLRTIIKGKTYYEK